MLFVNGRQSWRITNATSQPSTFCGVTLAQMARHAEAINALGADAIVMVGDLVDDQVEDIGALVDPVSDYSAPDGQYFAYGKSNEVAQIVILMRQAR